LEERRARAVSLRRVDPWLGREFGRLDTAAIDEVRKQAWPVARTPDELHDVLLGVGILPLGLQRDCDVQAEKLVRDGRATIAIWHYQGGDRHAYVAAERTDLVRLAISEVSFSPAVELPLGFHETVASPEEARKRIVQGWLEISGPIRAAELARRLDISLGFVDAALVALETAGVAMRGEFTGDADGEREIEWCDRVLLARIHRMTLGRMRREIEPVSAADFLKFLVAWQHVTPGTQLRGREGVLQIIRELQGLELPAPAWEQHVLPVRIERYDANDLEYLCLAGIVAWGRLRPGTNGSDENTPAIKLKRSRRLLSPGRNAPIAFLLRENLDAFIEPSAERLEAIPTLSAMALEVACYLEKHGASFLDDIARATGLLKVKVEEGLWQLVAHGLATGDGIAGLRVLLTPQHKRIDRRRSLRIISGGRSSERAMPVGRWSLWRNRSSMEALTAEAVLEQRAQQILRRYGIVFRDLLARESNLASWRSLLGIYRRLEARGEIRGGRFVEGFVGEQFALPEAVERLRAMRRDSSHQQPVIVSAADPLNLIGVITPGARLSPYSNQFIAYENGIPVAVGLLGELLSQLQHVATPS
jgi:ATP-dependent helicase Lhr and Lhr-like helicase